MSSSQVNKFTKNILQTNFLELWTNTEPEEDGEWISPEQFLVLYPKLMAIAFEKQQLEKKNAQPRTS